MLPKVNPWCVFFQPGLHKGKNGYLKAIRQQAKREGVHAHKFETEMKEACFIQSSTSVCFEDRSVCVVTHACCEKNAKCLDN